MTALSLCPIKLREANAFVENLHRHSSPVRGHLYSIGIDDGVAIRGVVIVGRPIAPGLEDGFTAEVLRCCTDGVRNGCSKLYGAAWRSMVALGFTLGVTYTLDEEGGASLRASGWRQVAELRPRSGWDTPSRRRDNTAYQSAKRWRWEKGKRAGRTRPPLPEFETHQEALDLEAA